MSTDVFITGDVVGGTSFHDEDDDNLNNLHGQLSGGSANERQRLSGDYNQLDEPILDTLLRDLTGIYSKMKIIALPLSSYDIYKVVLRGWDLWGPLLLCTFLAFELHHSDHEQVNNNNQQHSGPQFSDVFVLVWIGSCIISLNYRLLSASSANNYQISSKHSNPELMNPPNGHHSTSGDTKQTSESAINLNETISHSTLVSPPSIFQLMCVFGYCLVAPCFGLIILKLFSFHTLIFERTLIGLLFGFVWPTYCAIRILIRYQHPAKRALAIYPIGLFYFVLSCMIILNH